MDAQFEELFSFLSDERTEVRHLAAKHVASLTGSPDKSHLDILVTLFEKNDYHTLRRLMGMMKDEPLVAHEALSALINLTSMVEGDKGDAIFNVMDNESFINDLMLLIMLPKSILSDLCCMLLNNLTKSPAIIKRLIPADISASSSPDAAAKIQIRTKHLDNLLEVFVRGAKTGDSQQKSAYNPHANFHFLSGVFANVSATPGGADFLLGLSTVDSSQRLSRLIVFMDHEDDIRRGGVMSVLKNVCFLTKVHETVLFKSIDQGGLGVLPYLLLPLAGNEEYDEEDIDSLLPELQFLESTKTREPKASLRLILVESLLLLTTTLFGREYMRSHGVYPVLQKLHLWEKSEQVSEVVEKIVDMLKRDESEETLKEAKMKSLDTAITEVSSDEEEAPEIDVDDII